MQPAANNSNLIILTRDEWARQLAEAYKKGAEEKEKATATVSPSVTQKSKKTAKIKAKSGKTVEWRGAVVTDGGGE